jgi:hypothetical protein
LLVDFGVARYARDVLCGLGLGGVESVDVFLGFLDEEVCRGGVAGVAGEDLVDAAGEVWDR